MTDTRAFGQLLTNAPTFDESVKGPLVLKKAAGKKANKKKKKKKNIKKKNKDATPPKPETVVIKVPEGKQAGDEMVIEGHLGKFRVNVPEGLKAGDEFNLEIKEPNPEPDIVTVKVPEGNQAGDEMVIEGHLGKFKVNVPEGLKAGDEFQIKIDESNVEREEVVTVIVPAGAKAGDTITIDGDKGKFNCTVPEGFNEGDTFNCKLDEVNPEPLQ